MGDKLLLHTVHITFYVDTPEEKRIDILERFRGIAGQCGGKEAGILGWYVGKNTGRKKHVSLVEVALFESEEAFQKFREHPVHRSLREELSKLADWMPADVAVSRAALKEISTVL